MRLPFGTAQADDMFHYKIDVIVKELTKVFGITDECLIVYYDADNKEHYIMLKLVMEICHKKT